MLTIAQELHRYLNLKESEAKDAKSFELLKLKRSSQRAGVIADLSITNAEDSQTGLGGRKLSGKAFDGHVIDRSDAGSNS